MSEEEAETLASTVLVQYRADPDGPVHLDNWTIAPHAVGGNGVVWRAANVDGSSLAIKLSVVDSYHRGVRERAATRRLADNGLDIAPRPIVLVEDQGVTALVSEWLDGRGFDVAPEASSPLWDRFIATFVAIHSVDAEDLLESPAAAYPESLDVALVDATRVGWHRFGALATEVRRRVVDLPPLRRVLIHSDPNLTNWLVDDGELRVVDWEYSGAGDPCSDLAEFVTAPANLELDPSLSADLIERHAESLGAPELAVRTRAVVIAHLCWWCAHIATKDQTPAMPGTAMKVDAESRAGDYRDRLATELSMERGELDRFFES